MIRFLLLVSASLLATATLADDFFNAVETRHHDSTETEPRAILYKAWLQQKIGYGYHAPTAGFSRDSADLTRAETRLYGSASGKLDHWQWQLAGSLSHDWLAELDYSKLWSGYTLTHEQRDDRRRQWQFDDSYVAWQNDNWWIKGGYQTLAWGEAETLKVTDVLARRDQRWPGQEDLEQLRLPVPALLVTWRNQLELAVLPSFAEDSRIDRQAVAFDEFDRLIGLRDPNIAQPVIRLREEHNPGWALRWRHSRAGLDAQVMIADVHSFEPSLAGFTFAENAQTNLNAVPQLFQIELEQNRQQIIGIALQGVKGNWLLKTEQAWHQGISLQPQNPVAIWQQGDQWRGMLGLEYSGIYDLTISAETSHNYTPDWNEELSDKKWQAGHALRLRYTLLNERLTLGALAMQTSGDQGDVLRVTADWQVADEMTLSLTWVEYWASHKTQQLYAYRDNDALLLNLRWGL